MEISGVLEKKGRGQGENYIVMFIYRVSKKNREALVRLGSKLMRYSIKLDFRNQKSFNFAKLKI
jgi:hypothetical protein